jgi:hypothetical protein
VSERDVEEARRESESLFAFSFQPLCICGAPGEVIYTRSGEVQEASCVVAAHAQNAGIPGAVYAIKKKPVY